MNWAVLIPIMIQNGLPLVEKLWTALQSKTAPTQAEWDALRATQTSAKAKMLESLQKAGIDPNSDQGKALLALVS